MNKKIKLMQHIGPSDMMPDFSSVLPRRWAVLLLAMKSDNTPFGYVHMTLCFEIITPENQLLTWEVYKNVYNQLPKSIVVKTTRSTFGSEYNKRRNKIAVDVLIDENITKLVDVLERFGRATYRPHISFNSDRVPTPGTPFSLTPYITPSIMRTEEFGKRHMPIYKYKYILGIGSGTNNNKEAMK